MKLSKAFPYKYWATTLICIMASLQQVIIGLCVDRKRAAWSLGWNLQLIWVISVSLTKHPIFTSFVFEKRIFDTFVVTMTWWNKLNNNRWIKKSMTHIVATHLVCLNNRITTNNIKYVILSLCHHYNCCDKYLLPYSDVWFKILESQLKIA